MELAELYTIDQAAEYLKCDHRVVRRLISNNEIFAKRVGPRYLITATELDDYVHGRKSRSSTKSRRKIAA